eukprot:364648-Chlamydomonas_euryale.AAC.2
MSANMNMIFEVADLAVASPATVSGRRNGLGHQPGSATPGICIDQDLQHPGSASNRICNTRDLHRPGSATPGICIDQDLQHPGSASNRVCNTRDLHRTGSETPGICIEQDLQHPGSATPMMQQQKSASSAYATTWIAPLGTCNKHVLKHLGHAATRICIAPGM